MSGRSCSAGRSVFFEAQPLGVNKSPHRPHVCLDPARSQLLRQFAQGKWPGANALAQAAFGWTNSHLFEFLAGEGRWGIPDPDGDFGPQPIDARKTRLSNIVQETGAKTIHYLYDFGDSWDHVIKLEKWFDNTTTEGLPLLLEAAGRCPPEDVGGAPGYSEYLDAISDPTHPEHEHMRLWGPEQFDPNVVDRKALEAAVNALSEIWKPRRRTTRSK